VETGNRELPNARRASSSATYIVLHSHRRNFGTPGVRGSRKPGGRVCGSHQAASAAAIPAALGPREASDDHFDNRLGLVWAAHCD
jgi:hypothetical protein